MPRIGSSTVTAGGSTGYALWFPGRWCYVPAVGSFGNIGQSSTSTMGYIVRVPNPVTITQYAIIVTAAQASLTGTFALYNDDGTGKPNTLITGSSTTFDVSTTGTKTYTLTTPFATTAARHIWVLYQFNAATSGGTQAAFAPFNTFGVSTPSTATQAGRTFANVTTVGAADISSQVTSGVTVNSVSAPHVWFFVSSSTVS